MKTIVNVTNYIERKAKGLVCVAKVGKAYILSSRVFSAETGEEIEPQVEGIRLSGLYATKSQLENALADLVQLITDFEALE